MTTMEVTLASTVHLTNETNEYTKPPLLLLAKELNSTLSSLQFECTATMGESFKEMCKDGINVTDETDTSGFENCTIGVAISESVVDLSSIIAVSVVSFLSLATVLGNAALVLCIARNRHMLTVYNIYASSLAMADLLVGVIVMPSMSVYTYYGYWPLGSSFCTVWILFDFTCCTISMLHLDAIAFDRYKSVTSPLIYRATFTKGRAIKISVCMWVLGMLVWLPVIFWYRISDKEPVHDDCYFLPDKNFIAGQACAVYLVPVCFMIVMYILLTTLLHKRCHNTQQQSMRKGVYVITKARCQVRYKHDDRTAATETKDTDDGLDVCSQEVAPQAETTSKRTQSQVSKQEKKRKQNAGYSKISTQNKRCIRTLGVVIVVFLLCWMPFVTFWPVAAFCETCIPASLYEASYWLAYANSLVNPYIYFLLNRDFRQAFKRLFLRRGNTKGNHNFSNPSFTPNPEDSA